MTLKPNSRTNSHVSLRRQIDKAKARLPLSDLMELLGDGDLYSCSALCPFHDDHSPSFSVFLTEGGDALWKCWAGCGVGDQITYLEVKFGLTPGEAIRKFLKMARGQKGQA